MQSPLAQDRPRTREPGSDEIDLLVLFRLVVRNFKFLALVSLAFAVTGALWSMFVMQPIFESKAMITNRTSDSRAGQLGSTVSPLIQLLSMSGGNQQVAQFQKILESRALTEAVIDEGGLLKKLNLAEDQQHGLAGTKARLAKSLEKGVFIELEGDFLTISYRHTDPQFAYEIITLYLDQLTKRIQGTMQTSAKATEIFIEKRLQEAEVSLAEVEKKYVNFQKSEGLVALPSQLGITLSAASSLRNRLIEKEMEIALYRDIIKDSSEIQRLESERLQIKTQLDKLIEGQNRTSARGSGTTGSQSNRNIEIYTPLKQTGTLSVEFANMERLYLSQIKLVELLKNQLEVARIDSKRQESGFLTIDPPTIPIYQVAPNKTIITILSGMLGILIASLIVLMMNSIRTLPRFMYRIVKTNRPKPEAV